MFLTDSPASALSDNIRNRGTFHKTNNCLISGSLASTVSVVNARALTGRVCISLSHMAQWYSWDNTWLNSDSTKLHQEKAGMEMTQDNERLTKCWAPNAYRGWPRLFHGNPWVWKLKRLKLTGLPEWIRCSPDDLLKKVVWIGLYWI